jgi:hypothetical protein
MINSKKKHNKLSTRTSVVQFQQFLDEKRSHPDKNPKISLYDKLKPYSKNPNIFISLTEIDKIGINPQTQWKTPMGIYVYPLKEIWKQLKPDDKFLNLPFAEKAPYIWIVKNKCKNAITDISKTYSESQLKKDIKILEKKSKWSAQDIENALGYISPKISNPGVLLWEMLNNLTLGEGSKKALEWNKAFRLLGYCAVFDKSGSSTIHPNEPMQGVFFQKNAFTVIDKLYNKKEFGSTQKSFRWSEIKKVLEMYTLYLMGDKVIARDKKRNEPAPISGEIANIKNLTKQDAPLVYFELASDYEYSFQEQVGKMFNIRPMEMQTRVYSAKDSEVKFSNAYSLSTGLRDGFMILYKNKIYKMDKDYISKNKEKILELTKPSKTEFQKVLYNRISMEY